MKLWVIRLFGELCHFHHQIFGVDMSDIKMINFWGDLDHFVDSSNRESG